MIRSFGDAATRDIFDGIASKSARGICPRTLWSVARRKLDLLNQAKEMQDLKAPPGNRLEKLKGKLQDYHSIRINDQYRVCFRWTKLGPKSVRILDYHR